MIRITPCNAPCCGGRNGCHCTWCNNGQNGVNYLGNVSCCMQLDISGVERGSVNDGDECCDCGDVDCDNINGSWQLARPSGVDVSNTTNCRWLSFICDASQPYAIGTRDGGGGERPRCYWELTIQNENPFAFYPVTTSGTILIQIRLGGCGSSAGSVGNGFFAPIVFQSEVDYNTLDERPDCSGFQNYDIPFNENGTGMDFNASTSNRGPGNCDFSNATCSLTSLGVSYEPSAASGASPSSLNCNYSLLQSDKVFCNFRGHVESCDPNDDCCLIDTTCDALRCATGVSIDPRTGWGDDECGGVGDTAAYVINCKTKMGCRCCATLETPSSWLLDIDGMYADNFCNEFAGLPSGSYPPDCLPLIDNAPQGYVPISSYDDCLEDDGELVLCEELCEDLNATFTLDLIDPQSNFCSWKYTFYECEPSGVGDDLDSTPLCLPEDITLVMDCCQAGFPGLCGGDGTASFTLAMNSFYGGHATWSRDIDAECGYLDCTEEQTLFLTATVGSGINRGQQPGSPMTPGAYSQGCISNGASITITPQNVDTRNTDAYNDCVAQL